MGHWKLGGNSLATRFTVGKDAGEVGLCLEAGARVPRWGCTDVRERSHVK